MNNNNNNNNFEQEDDDEDPNSLIANSVNGDNTSNS
jgi:hypothetical protein